MGYLIQKNFLKGFIEERRVNGVGVNYSINIQYLTFSKCNIVEEVETFFINNAINSERRYFNITQTKNYVADCEDSDTIESSPPKTIKISGVGPLPTKYLKLYGLLEARASKFGDEKITVEEDINYKIVDPDLIKNNILLNLIESFPTQLSDLGSFASPLQSTNGDTSSCCVGEVTIIARLVKYANADYMTYSEYAGTVQVLTKTKCLDKVECEGITKLPLYHTSCAKEVRKLKSFSAENVEFEIMGNLAFFGDYAIYYEGTKYDIPVKIWSGTVTIRQAVKLGCCVGPCPDKIRSKLYTTLYGGPYQFDLRTVKEPGDRNPFTENSLLTQALLANFGIGNDVNPITFSSCRCSDSYRIEGTSTSTLM